jgi:biotin-dependent carboxylase-like uncharacterized protein
MRLRIVEPGVQTTLQASPRRGFRHFGVPWSGAADSLSFDLANAAVGNPPGVSAIEVTHGGASFEIQGPGLIVVTGALAPIALDGETLDRFEPFTVRDGQRLSIGQVTVGARLYVAVRGGLVADDFLRSASTYLPAGFGGHEGRTLRSGDVLQARQTTTGPPRAIPAALQPFLESHWVVHATPSSETGALSRASRLQAFGIPFGVSRRGDRMGIALEGPDLKFDQPVDVRSGPVFPGTVQLPQTGQPFILLVDGQTTGGYPRIAQVISADRHRLGQLYPGDTIAFSEVGPTEARVIALKKRRHLAGWITS